MRLSTTRSRGGGDGRARKFVHLAIKLGRAFASLPSRLVVSLRLGSASLDGFWIHLDADVLDDKVMPAVDYRMPDGLHWDELSIVLKRAIGSGRALGIDITIFNPKLDENRAIAHAFVDVLAKEFAGDGA